MIERGQAIRDVKGLAKQLGCPVVILAQLNRDAANGRPPEIKDIRGSGGIEEAAGMILFVHRPDYYNPE
ncbi:DnaB-like helicase C-terminal domain-containing protein, partial [Enterobacter hormaechei]|uniref:DnaB-like helicase C-terminal domain-containing protein n=1 Tax=Enterobacter hormaechei TaxID=158836 RepID=UPI00203F780B